MQQIRSLSVISIQTNWILGLHRSPTESENGTTIPNFASVSIPATITTPISTTPECMEQHHQLRLQTQLLSGLWATTTLRRLHSGTSHGTDGTIIPSTPSK